jgi:surface protein
MDIMRSVLFAILMLSSVANAQDFYLAPNGVTCMCPNAAVGASGDPGNGVVYTKRTTSEVTTANASTTCTSGITDMFELFDGNQSFNEDISSWDVSSVTDMGAMFRGALSFNQDLSNWDVGSVTYMNEMFRLSGFNSNISSWDVSSVLDFYMMFFGATFYNQPLDQWDISNVFKFDYMFKNATSFNQPLNSWDTTGVTRARGMFTGASSFNQPLNNWNMTLVTICDDMFKLASSFNQDLSQWEFLSLNSSNPFHGFVRSSGMDVNNYDLLLESFMNQGLQSFQLLSHDLEYCNTNARNNLINNLGWTFWGDQYNQSTISAPPSLQYNLQSGECSVTNLDLGIPTYAAGCGPVVVSNNSPAEFFPGNYTIIWTLEDSNGVLINDNQFIEIVFPVDQADVCYVTSDWNNPSKNRIWISSDPVLSGQNVAYHEVFREASSGAFETIGFIYPPNESFLDTSSDNSTQAYRYRVQTVDVCGQELSLSDYHKTILLQSGIATNNSVNLAWNPYIGISFNTYNVYRSVNGANYELLTSLSSNNITFNDTSANVADNFYEYYISIDVASCSTDPFQSFALRSNLEYINPNLVIKDNSWLSSAITFYPNPTSGYLNISINEGLELDGVTIYNALGQKVSQTKGTAQIDVSHIPSGIYYLSISTDQGTVTKTMVRR